MNDLTPEEEEIHKYVMFWFENLSKAAQETLSEFDLGALVTFLVDKPEIQIASESETADN